MLAIDDFGTGHSSLTRLRDLPVQILKIDRSFLQPVPHDPQAGAIVAAVLGLGRALGMTDGRRGRRDAEQRDVPRRARLPARAGLPPRPPGRRPPS